MHNKPIIGLLGGIGSGKSTVAAEFSKLGCLIIDADRISHALIQKNTVIQQLVNLLGPDILTAAGNPDRKKIAASVFNDPDKLKALNSIIHPAVLCEMDRQIKKNIQNSNFKAIILDIPLLVEIGWDKRCTRIIFIECNEQIRMERARVNKNMQTKEFKNRENFQISLDKKRCLADNTINNVSDLSTLVRQIEFIFSDIVKS